MTNSCRQLAEHERASYYKAVHKGQDYVASLVKTDENAADEPKKWVKVLVVRYKGCTNIQCGTVTFMIVVQDLAALRLQLQCPVQVSEGYRCKSIPMYVTC
eukprot:2410868-Amphidinium_carterae.1